MLTIAQMAQETGHSVSNLKRLVAAGVLPHTRDGKTIMLDEFDCKVILSNHEPGKHWIPGKKRPGRTALNELRRSIAQPCGKLQPANTADMSDPWAALL